MALAERSKADNLKSHLKRNRTTEAKLPDRAEHGFLPAHKISY